METNRRVADAYVGRSILVTGASGFLGKVLVEKLLFSLPEIGNIFLLIRRKENMSSRKRLDKMLESCLFNRLRSRNPQAFSKLVPVDGDLCIDELGLSTTDRETLCDEVSIVFHCAASVSFDKPLRYAFDMNVLGTQRLIALSRAMKTLSVFVHVSTAYAHCDRLTTLEQIYPSPVPFDKLFQALAWMDDQMIKAVTPYWLGNRPNSYTFTKALAEVQLVENAQQLPVIIIRPAIICSTWRDPIPGWTDNMNGPTGLVAACAKGVLTNMYGSAASKADIIPVDIVSNMLIVSAFYRMNLKCQEIPVVHCTSGGLNPVTWGHFIDYIQCFFRKYPLNDCYGVPSAQFHSSRLLFMLNFYTKHLAPAYIIDFVRSMIGQKAKYVRLYGKVSKMIESLHYFTTHDWNFETKGLQKMWDAIADDDKLIFNFDVRQINWDSYFFDYLMGVKRYIVGERIEELSIARKNLDKLKVYSMTFSAFFWWIFVQFFTRRKGRRQKWFFWTLGFLCTYFRSYWKDLQSLRLKRLEEY